MSTMRKTYYTTDTHELAPHPDMTGEDLRDFEVWAAEVDRTWIWTWGRAFRVVLAVALLAAMAYIGVSAQG